MITFIFKGFKFDFQSYQFDVMLTTILTVILNEIEKSIRNLTKKNIKIICVSMMGAFYLFNVENNVLILSFSK